MEFWAMHWFDSVSSAYCDATPADFARLMIVVIAAGWLIGRYTSR